MADIRSAIHASAAGVDGLPQSLADEARLRRNDGAPPPDPYADEAKWPAWKVSIAVIVFCAAFWTGIGYLAFRLLG